MNAKVLANFADNPEDQSLIAYELARLGYKDYSNQEDQEKNRDLLKII